MLYLITGKDSFRALEHLKEVLEFYKKENPSFFVFDFSDGSDSDFKPDISSIQNALSSNTLFSKIKLVVFKDSIAELSSNDQKKFISIIKENQLDKAKNIMVVFYEVKEEGEEKEGKNSLYKFIKEKAKIRKDFPLLTGKELFLWLENQEKKLDIKLTKSSQTMIALSFGSDTGSIWHSLKKLSLLKKGAIDEKTVGENLFLPYNADIFAFLDSLASRKIEKALDLLGKELAKGAFPLYILKMIILEFRNLLRIKTSKSKNPTEIQKKTGLHPYVFRKLYPLANSFSFAELRFLYRRLLNCDRKIKNGSIAPNLGLEMFILDLKNLKSPSLTNRK